MSLSFGFLAWRGNSSQQDGVLALYRNGFSGWRGVVGSLLLLALSFFALLLLSLFSLALSFFALLLLSLLLLSLLSFSLALGFFTLLFFSLFSLALSFFALLLLSLLLLSLLWLFSLALSFFTLALSFFALLLLSLALGFFALLLLSMRGFFALLLLSLGRGFFTLLSLVSLAARRISHADCCSRLDVLWWLMILATSQGSRRCILLLWMVLLKLTPCLLILLFEVLHERSKFGILFVVLLKVLFLSPLEGTAQLLKRRLRRRVHC